MQINVRLIRAIVAGIGLVGLLVVGYGIYSAIGAINTYNDLNALPTPSADTVQQMNQAGDQAGLMALAGIELAKRDQLSKRAQATSYVGAGAAIFGVGVLLFIQLPAAPHRKPVEPLAPSASEIEHRPELFDIVYYGG